VSNGPGSSSETLFVHGASYRGIGSIDPATLVLSPISPFDPDTYQQHQVELTGNGNGDLFGLFVKNGTVEFLATIGKTTAQVTNEKVLDFSALGGFAFAFWGGAFWIFTNETVQR
jgi:hypothetical protein